MGVCVFTSRACCWPMKPAAVLSAVPSSRRPRPLMCECAATRFSRAVPAHIVLETILQIGGLLLQVPLTSDICTIVKSFKGSSFWRAKILAGRIKISSS